MARWQVAAVVGAIIALVGCAKEESTEPTQPRNYFPLQVGNWWVFDGVGLDTAGVEKPWTGWRDSMVIVGQLNERQAYVAVRYRSNSSTSDTMVFSSDTMVFSSDGLRLYMFVPRASEWIPGPTGWVKIADYSVSSWAIWDTMLTNVPLDPNNPSLTVSGPMRWRGEKGELLRLMIEGRQVEAQEFRVRVSFDGRLFVRGMEAGTVTFSLSLRRWVAEGIGIVREQADPAELRIQSAQLGNSVMKLEGERGVLVDYNVQQ